MKAILNIELLKNFIKENQMTIKEFCEFCNISVSTYHNLRKKRNCRFETLYNIAKNTHLSCDDLLGITKLNEANKKSGS